MDRTSVHLGLTACLRTPGLPASATAAGALRINLLSLRACAYLESNGTVARNPRPPHAARMKQLPFPLSDPVTGTQGRCASCGMAPGNSCMIRDRRCDFSSRFCDLRSAIALSFCRWKALPMFLVERQHAVPGLRCHECTAGDPSVGALPEGTGSSLQEYSDVLSRRDQQALRMGTYGQRLGMLCARSAPETAIQRAVLDGFRDMAYGDARLGIEVRNGASDLQYPVVRACAQALLLHGSFQQTFGLR